MAEQEEIALKALIGFELACTDPNVSYDINAGDVVVIPYNTVMMKEMVSQLIFDGVCELDTGEDVHEYKGSAG